MNVQVDNLEPGMKLARDITNESGMVLIVRSTLLTPELIKRLQGMAIDSVSIVAPGSSMPPKDRIFAELQKRFSKTNGDPNMDHLRQLFEARLDELYRDAP